MKPKKLLMIGVAAFLAGVALAQQTNAPRSREGDVSHLTVISGHPLLAEAAMNAVEQWKYKPLLLNGNPVEIQTTIVVRFHM
jgi:protein TonB